MSSNSFAVPDPSAAISDESASIVSTTTLDAIPPTSPPVHHQTTMPMAADDRSTDRAAQQLSASAGSRPAQAGQGGQPLPPSSSLAPTSASSSSAPVPSSPSAPSNLSAYARLMLEHTKQQLDATSALPPPPHIRVAGPLGHSSSSQYQQQRHRHAHSASLPNGTSPSLNGVPATHS